MLRLVLLGSAVALCAAPASAGGEPGPASWRAPLPPEVAHRDPTYLAPPPRRAVVYPLALPPTILAGAPRSLALPLYNEPPPRFAAP